MSEKPNIEVCSNCREALCREGKDWSPPADDHPICRNHLYWDAYPFTSGIPHHADIISERPPTPANAACARAKLVTVKNCLPLRDDGCPWWSRAEGGLVYCDLADLHIYPSLKFGLPTNELKGGKACPLTDDDGKPNAGVQVVAEVEG